MCVCECGTFECAGAGHVGLYVCAYVSVNMYICISDCVSICEDMDVYGTCECVNVYVKMFACMSV